MSAESRVRHPAAWVPSSYFAEGVPYAILTGTVATMFLNLGGHTDGEITFATGSIGIAWSLKPLWAAFLDRYKTKKFFVLAMELAMAALLGMVALALQLPNYFAVISAVLWVAAFASATQDICVDGVYLTSLDKKAIAFWAGIQGPFWLVGRTFATGAVVALAGVLRDRGILGTTAWMYAFGLAAAVMGALGIYHYFMLPTGSILRQSKEEVDEVPTSMALRLGVGIGSGTVLAAWITYSSGVATIGSIVGVVAAALIIVGWREHVPPFLAFVRKKSIVGMLLFVFLYRTGEGFLIAEGPLFMQAAVEKGGLGVSLGQKALIDGVVSTIMSALAGILGGMFVSRYGLKRSLLLLAFFMNVPHVCYVYLSHSVSPGHPLPLSTIWHPRDDREVRVQLRVHRQHGLHDAADRAGEIQDDPLRLRDFVHATGPGPDADGEREAGRLDGLPAFLHLRDDRLRPELVGSLEGPVPRSEGRGGGEQSVR